jgi:hypothetical protein
MTITLSCGFSWLVKTIAAVLNFFDLYAVEGLVSISKTTVKGLSEVPK